MVKNSWCSYVYIGLMALSLAPQARLTSADLGFLAINEMSMSTASKMLLGFWAVGLVGMYAWDRRQAMASSADNQLRDCMKKEEGLLLKAVEHMLMNNEECLKSLAACVETLTDEDLDRAKVEKECMVVITQGELRDALAAYYGFLKSVAPWCRECAKSVTDQSDLWMAFEVREKQQESWESQPDDGGSMESSCCCHGNNRSFELTPFMHYSSHVGEHVAHSPFIDATAMDKVTWNYGRKRARIVINVHIVAVQSCYRVEIKISAESV